MSNNLEMLKADVPGLSPADRARLLDMRVASLDADPGAEADWDAIADERERELGSGVVKAVPLEEVIARLAARYPSRASTSATANGSRSAELAASLR